MTRKRFDEIIAAKDELGIAANKLLDEYNAVHLEITGEKINGYGHLYFKEVDARDLEYSGDEYWSYGGHERHSYSIPLESLFSSDWKQGFMDRLKEDIDMASKVEAENNKAAIVAEKRKLKELLAKYGSDA